MRRLIGTLVVVVALLVVADIGGRFVAERTVAERLQTEQRLSNRPDVSIAGFPFLTQFASGRYQHVRATAHDVPVGQTSLRLTRLQVDFRGVSTDRRFERFSARRGQATATLGYADLSRALDARITYASDGRITATKTFTVLGEKVSPSISVRPRVVDDVLSFTGAQVDRLGDLPGPVQAALEGIFTSRLPLSGLPFDATVSDLRVTSAGIVLTLTAHDLRYAAARR